MVSRFDDFDAPMAFFVPEVGLAVFANAQAALTTTATTPLATVSPTPVAAATTTNSVLADMMAHETNGVLAYAGALAVLQDAAAQTMTSALFANLQAAARDIDVTGGVSAAAYVQQIFDDVTLGNSANAYWNGGATTPTKLGNLSATASKTQFSELIGKWFLGTDMPGDAGAPGAGAAGVAYKTYTLPLFTSAGPKITDVNQGQLGDCWFLAAVGETALLDPTLISQIITAHGNGTYSVEFQVNGKADYVTVNGALPTYTNGAAQYDGSKMANANSTTSLWVPLIEKALAQLSEQTGVVTGEQYSGNQDQYYDLSSGGGEGVTLLTGQPTGAYGIAGLGTTGLAALLGNMQSDLTAGHDVLLATSGKTAPGNLVADHMFAVTGINATAGTVNLYNPWGANGVGESKPESFTIAASALASDNAYFFAASGAVNVTARA